MLYEVITLYVFLPYPVLWLQTACSATTAHIKDEFSHPCFYFLKWLVITSYSIHYTKLYDYIREKYEIRLYIRNLRAKLC